MITNKIDYDKRIPSRAVILFYEIKRLSKKSGYCFASNEWLSKKFQAHRVTITRWLGSLEKCGYIKRDICYTKDIRKVRKIFVLGNQGNLDQNNSVNGKKVKNASYNNICNNGGENEKQKCLDPINKNASYNNIKINTSITSCNTSNTPPPKPSSSSTRRSKKAERRKQRFALKEKRFALEEEFHVNGEEKSEIVQIVQNLPVSPSMVKRILTLCPDRDRLAYAIMRATIPGFKARDLTAVIISNYKHQYEITEEMEKRIEQHERHRKEELLRKEKEITIAKNKAIAKQIVEGKQNVRLFYDFARISNGKLGVELVCKDIYYSDSRFEWKLREAINIFSQKHEEKLVFSMPK